jgi:ABC-type uncharacterized transport system ATPase subunit
VDQPQANSVVLEIENLTKAFGDFIANDRIHFNLQRGEVHCLLGENGAGKSTFAKCLYGAYKPDTGSIKVNGREVEFGSPREAIHLGIGMVHQHFVLVPTMTVVENIIVGVEKKGISPGLREAAQKVSDLCKKFNVHLDPFAPVSSLSVGEQQWVEILKTLFSGVEILILDEPTSALTPQESDQLFSVIKKMTRDGTSVIFITHKLNEVMALSDRVTIFRKGKVVDTVATITTSKMELATLMVGHDVRFEVEKAEQHAGEVILQIRNLKVLNEKKREALKSINLDVRRDEILGIAGVGGNGQVELFDALVGVRPVAEGNISLDGKELTRLSPSRIAKSGLASVPSDRIAQGLMMDFSVAENMILGCQRSFPFRKGIFLDEKTIEANARHLIKEYDVVTSGLKQPVFQLSGGNLQKLILARELSRDIRCIVAHCPTRGLDVGAIEYVHHRLVELRDKGIAVLLISEDLDEIFEVADRIAVIFQGEIMGEFQTKQTSRKQIGLLMAGVREGSL